MRRINHVNWLGDDLEFRSDLADKTITTAAIPARLWIEQDGKYIEVSAAQAEKLAVIFADYAAWRKGK